MLKIIDIPIKQRISACLRRIYKYKQMGGIELECMVEQYEMYKKQLIDIEAEIEELTLKVPGIKKMLSIKGVGIITAAGFIAEVGDLSRYQHPRQIPALFVKTDVGDEKSIQALAEKAFSTFGKVDILVNNAIIYRPGPILELPIEAWDRVYEVNLRGAVLGIKTFLPGMLERGEGVIVMFTSSEGMPYMASYFASKAALQSLGLSLAGELDEKSGVLSLVFAPGMVDTPGGKQAFQALAPRYGMTYQEILIFIGDFA